MIIFESDSPKKLALTTLIEGIDPGSLTFCFRINVKGVEYGFPAKVVNEQIQVKVPALNNIIADLVEGIYTARLDVQSIKEQYIDKNYPMKRYGGQSGFYMKAWEGEVVVKPSPKIINTQIVEEEEPEQLIQFNEEIEEVEKFEKKVPKPKQKKREKGKKPFFMSEED